MDENYIIRKASFADAGFIADVIIGAEKSMTENLGLGNIFEIPEDELRELIINMLEEEIEGCEFSIDSFFVAYFNDIPVAALGGWLEGYPDNMPSSMLKSNLIRATFPAEKLNKISNKLEIIKDVQIDRERNMYQLEYSFVDSAHRGKRLTKYLMATHLDYAKKMKVDVKKAQLHVFENNEIITQIHQRSGFKITKRYVSNNEEILHYLPHNVKLLMEKSLSD